MRGGALPHGSLQATPLHVVEFPAQLWHQSSTAGLAAARKPRLHDMPKRLPPGSLQIGLRLPQEMRYGEAARRRCCDGCWAARRHRSVALTPAVMVRRPSLTRATGRSRGRDSDASTSISRHLIDTQDTYSPSKPSRAANARLPAGRRRHTVLGCERAHRLLRRRISRHST